MMGDGHACHVGKQLSSHFRRVSKVCQVAVAALAPYTSACYTQEGIVVAVLDYTRRVHYGIWQSTEQMLLYLYCTVASLAAR